jgi:hypothetical protein
MWEYRALEKKKRAQFFGSSLLQCLQTAEHKVTLFHQHVV